MSRNNNQTDTSATRCTAFSTRVPVGPDGGVVVRGMVSIGASSLGCRAVPGSRPDGCHQDARAAAAHTSTARGKCGGSVDDGLLGAMPYADISLFHDPEAQNRPMDGSQSTTLPAPTSRPATGAASR